MKREMFRKLMAASLATVMAMSMAGCGSEDAGASSAESSTESSVAESSSTESTEASSVEEDVNPYPVLTDENGNVYDLGGMEIVIRDWWSNKDNGTDGFDITENDYGEATKEYMDWAQETYNFKIRRESISDWGSAPQDFVDYVTTGGDENNYVFALRQDAAITSAMGQGLMYDLATLKSFDFSEDKWKSGVHELMSKGDSIYCMSPYDPEPRTGVFFNKRLLSEAGIDPEELYDLQENMEWTWDKFEELCAKVQRDIDSDGTIDIYAMDMNDSVLYNAAVFSNGGEYVGMENGEYTYRLEDEETLAGLEWGVKMVQTYTKTLDENGEAPAWDYYNGAFVNGEIVFCIEQAYCAGAPGSGSPWAEMADDYGFVCFPMGPNATDYTNCYSDNPYAIPACYDADKAEKIAFAFNVITDPTPGYEDYPAWRAGYYAKFRDTESVDLTLTRMVSNGMVTYDGLIPNLKLGEDLTWKLGSTPVSECVEAIAETWKSYIAEANAQ